MDIQKSVDERTKKAIQNRDPLVIHDSGTLCPFASLTDLNLLLMAAGQTPVTDREELVELEHSKDDIWIHRWRVSPSHPLQETAYHVNDTGIIIPAT